MVTCTSTSTGHGHWLTVTGSVASLPVQDTWLPGQVTWLRAFPFCAITVGFDLFYLWVDASVYVAGACM